MEIGDPITAGEFSGIVVGFTPTLVLIRLANEATVAVPLSAIDAAAPPPVEAQEGGHD